MPNITHDQLTGSDLHDNKVYPATGTPLPAWTQTDARYQAKGSITGLPAATTTQSGIVTNSDWTSFINKGYRSAYVVGPSGSVGNDYTGNGTADDVTLNAAIQSGRTVYIKDGTYNLTHRINLNGKQNIRIIGESKAVIFQIPQASLTNFGFSYMIGGNATSSDIYIEGLYLYGGYSSYTNPDTNSGGGINPGKRWVIYNCTFEDFTYFPVFIGTDTSDSKIINCRWIGPGHGGDSIGGGGGNNIEVYGGVWEANVNGSAFDNTSGTHYSIHHGMIKYLLR